MAVNVAAAIVADINDNQTVLCGNREDPSSSTNSTPPIGAPNATATPSANKQKNNVTLKSSPLAVIFKKIYH
jgi:hypothetical protein